MLRNSPLHILLTGMMAWAGTARALQGQEVVRISSTPTCPTCRIEVRQVATIGSPEDSVSVNRQLRRNGRGEYVGVSRWTPYAVAVFDSSGELVGLHGRAGRGPGDYARIEFVEVGPGDTVHVFDLVQRRRTLLEPVSWKPARVAPLPILPQVGTIALTWGAHVLLPDGRYVVNAEKGDSALHLVGKDGELVRSFGAGCCREELPPPPSRGDLSVLDPYRVQELQRLDAIDRQLAAAGSGRVWAAYWNRYEVELWDTAGRRLRRVVREAEWFKAWRWDAQEAAATRRPSIVHPPEFRALQQDDSGRVWTIVSVAPDDEGGGREGAAVRHTVIEVLDPSAGRLIAAVRVEAPVMDFVGPGLVAVRETGAYDVPIVKVLSVSLREN